MEVGQVVVDDMSLMGGYGKGQETAEAVRQLRTMAIDMKRHARVTQRGQTLATPASSRGML